MRKRGFTLTEVLGVIVILGLITLIVFPNVNKSIKSSKQKLYDQQIALIEENARKWGVEHTAELPDSGSYYLELNDLVLGGYVSQAELKDPRNEKPIKGCIVISYDPAYNQYKYLYTEVSCDEQKPEEYPLLTEKINESLEVTANDPDQNKRYVGKDPSNYVSFNGKLFRMIGIFNGRVKIIQNDFYSTGLRWDTTGGINGSNNWARPADLNTELNSTYWNSISATYQNMVDQSHVWNLGGWSTPDITRAQMYQYENGTTVYGSNPTRWTGKVALMYVSDYAYASNGGSTCDSTTLYNWNGSPAQEECAQKSWLYNSSVYQWTLTPRSDYSDLVFVVTSSGFVGDYYANCDNYGVRPVLYLKSDVKVTGGSGTSNSPYILSQ